jgi:hypothetical protein
MSATVAGGGVEGDAVSGYDRNDGSQSRFGRNVNGATRGSVPRPLRAATSRADAGDG